MKTAIRVVWEVERPSFGNRIHRGWDIQRTAYNHKDLARKQIISANSMKFYKVLDCSQAQLENPEIDLSAGSVEFKCMSRMKRFDHEGYYRKCKKMAEELFKYEARINGLPGINWNDIKLDRELFYSIEEEEVIVRIKEIIKITTDE